MGLSSAFTAAHRLLAGACADAQGRDARLVLADGQSLLVVPSEISASWELLAGGADVSSAVQLSIARADLATIPAKGARGTYRGRKLKVAETQDQGPTVLLLMVAESAK